MPTKNNNFLAQLYRQEAAQLSLDLQQEFLQATQGSLGLRRALLKNKRLHDANVYNPEKGLSDWDEFLGKNQRGPTLTPQGVRQAEARKAMQGADIAWEKFITSQPMKGPRWRSKWQPAAPLPPDQWIASMHARNAPETARGIFRIPEAFVHDPAMYHLQDPVASPTVTKTVNRIPTPLKGFSKKWAIAGAAALTGAYLFSGHNSNYNTIEGFDEQGLSSFLRKQNTDFGSGYQGLQQPPQGDSGFNILPFAAAGGIGAGTGAGLAFKGLRPSLTFDQIISGSSGLDFDPEKYPRLDRLRKIGSKHGLKIVFPVGAKLEKQKGLPGIFQRTLWGKEPYLENWKGLEKYKGIVYNFFTIPGDKEFHYGSRPKNLINFGSWNIGVDKYWTWAHYQKQGLSNLHAETFEFLDIVSGQGEDNIGELFERSSRKGTQVLDDPAVKPFLDYIGGKQNFVLKTVTGSLQEGVWVGGENIPNEAMEKAFDYPDNFLIQKKLDLAAEFRAVTVGGKSVFAAHRFGSDEVNKMIDLLPSEYSSMIRESHLQENVVPIFSPTVRKSLDEFAERAAGALPKDIDITAFDIGLTKQGEYKIIEMQRGFGSIKNPLVNRRISEMITGKTRSFTKYGIAAGAIVGLGLGLGGYSLFSGRDDAYNTIEGFHEKGLASTLRKQNTDFGSGYDPIRAMARALKMSFKQFTERKSFQEALSGGTMVKELESGAFGITHLMKTKVDGKEIQYIRKTLHSEDQVAKNVFENNMLYGKPISMKEAKTWTKEYYGFEKEGLAYRSLGKTETVPSYYGESGGSLYMELMPGETMVNLASKGGRSHLPESALQQLYRTADAASAKGIYNFDMRMQNVMFDEASGRVSSIDWGYVDIFVPHYNDYTNLMKKNLKMFKGGTSPAKTIHEKDTIAAAGKTAGGTKPQRVRKDVDIGHAKTMLAKTVAKIRLNQSAADLRKAQQQLTHCGIHGGRYHTKRAKGHVKQLSRYGGDK